PVATSATEDAARRRFAAARGHERGRMGHLHVLQTDSGGATAALLQRRIVPRRLRPDQPPEAERLPGDRQLLARVVDDLQEETRVRAALVQLACRVQVARPVAVRDDESALSAELADEVADAAVVVVVRLDERLHADVVALVRL